MVVASGRARIAFRWSRRSAIVVAIVSSIAVAAASWGMVAIVTTVDHANADAAYQRARVKLAPIGRELEGARTEFVAARGAVRDLGSQITEIQKASGDFLSAEQRGQLAATASDIATALQLTEGEAPSRQEAVGSPSSSTDELKGATATILTQTSRESSWLQMTRRSVQGLSAREKLSTSLLVQIIEGLPKRQGAAGIAGLNADGAAVIASFPRAEQPVKDALTGSAAAASAGVAAHRAPGPLLLDYLRKAGAVRDSQAAVDAAAAAAAAAAAEAARAAAAEAAAERSSAGSGGGVGNGPPYAIPPPNWNTHYPILLVLGDYRPGCTGTFKYEYVAPTQYAGTTLDPPYPYSYTTFPTDNAWGVRVYACN